MRETPLSSIESSRHHLASMSATLALLLLCFGLMVACQEREGDRSAKAKQVELGDRFWELYQAGRYGEAIPVAEELVSLTETLDGPDHPDVAINLNNLAELYHEQGVVETSENAIDFAQNIERLYELKSEPEMVQRRLEVAHKNSWDSRYKELEKLVCQTLYGAKG